MTMFRVQLLADAPIALMIRRSAGSFAIFSWMLEEGEIPSTHVSTLTYTPRGECVCSYVHEHRLHRVY